MLSFLDQWLTGNWFAQKYGLTVAKTPYLEDFFGDRRVATGLGLVVVRQAGTGALQQRFFGLRNENRTGMSVHPLKCLVVNVQPVLNRLCNAASVFCIVILTSADADIAQLVAEAIQGKVCAAVRQPCRVRHQIKSVPQIVHNQFRAVRGSELHKQGSQANRRATAGVYLTGVELRQTAIKLTGLNIIEHIGNHSQAGIASSFEPGTGPSGILIDARWRTGSVQCAKGDFPDFVETGLHFVGQDWFVTGSHQSSASGVDRSPIDGAP